MAQKLSAPLENLENFRKNTRNSKNPERLTKTNVVRKKIRPGKEVLRKNPSREVPRRADIRAGAEAPVGGTKMRDTPHANRINRNIIHVHQHPGRVGRGQMVHFFAPGQ